MLLILYLNCNHIRNNASFNISELGFSSATSSEVNIKSLSKKPNIQVYSSSCSAIFFSLFVTIAIILLGLFFNLVNNLNIQSYRNNFF